MIALLVILTLAQLREDYRAAVSQGETLVAAMVNAIDQHLGGSIRAVDGLLDEVASAVETGRWPTAQFSDRLAVRLGGFPEIRYVGLVDAKGHLQPATVPHIDLGDEGVNVADRDYFFRQRDSHGPSMVFIGAPVIGRISSERTIHLSRPVRDAHGNFAGVVVAAINPDHYARFLETVLLEEAGASAVIRKDGWMLARAPAHAEKFGENIATSDLFTKFIPQGPVGVGHLLSRADGNDKLVGYRVMDNYPLVVTSGLSIHTALRQWRLLAGIEAVMVLLFSGTLYHWARQADTREGRLHEHQEQLEDMVAERTGELRWAREVAEQRARRLAVVNQELRRLAQVTAHHLQEPVRPIVSYSQMIRRKLTNLDPEMDSWLSFVENGGVRLKALLRDFQRYASVLAEEPDPHPVSVEAVVRQAMDRLMLAIEATGTRVDFGELPQVLADEAMLVNVFQQLIDNAIRHRHPDRTPHIVVQVEDDGPAWRFVVIDNGKGVEPALAAKAFEAFERLGTSAPNSTGLGLAICRAVVQAHGGRIWVEALPEGSRFCFTLAKVARADLDDQPPTSEPEA
jgi:signal transduction histidine kinase